MSEEHAFRELVTLRASDLARYRYCRRAWWLQRVLGQAPENREALEAGTARHEAHGRAVAQGRREMHLAIWLLLVALVAAVTLLFSLWPK